MKVTTREALETLFTEELGKYINREEIDNAVLIMDNGFDNNDLVDEEKLRKAIGLAEGYLLSVSLTDCILNACMIYKQRVLIVLAKAIVILNK